MAELSRQAPFGQLVCITSGNRYFRYREEKEDFHCLQCYHLDASPSPEMIVEQSFDIEAIDGQLIEATKGVTYGTKLDLEKMATSSDPESEDDLGQEPARASGLQRTQTLPSTSEELERLQIAYPSGRNSRWHYPAEVGGYR